MNKSSHNQSSSLMYASVMPRSVSACFKALDRRKFGLFLMTTQFYAENFPLLSEHIDLFEGMCVCVVSSG